MPHFIDAGAKFFTALQDMVNNGLIEPTEEIRHKVAALHGLVDESLATIDRKANKVADSGTTAAQPDTTQPPANEAELAEELRGVVANYDERSKPTTASPEYLEYVNQSMGSIADALVKFANSDTEAGRVVREKLAGIQKTGAVAHRGGAQTESKPKAATKKGDHHKQPTEPAPALAAKGAGKFERNLRRSKGAN